MTLRTTAETIQTSTRMFVRARTVHVPSLRCAATTASVSRRTGVAITTTTAGTAAMNSTAVTSNARSVDSKSTPPPLCVVGCVRPNLIVGYP